MDRQDTELLDWYVYNFQFDGLAPAAQASVSTQIEADSNFILTKITGFADIAAAGQTDATRIIPLVTLQIFDTGSGRNLLNGETAWGNIVGTGELPYILPIRRKWKANSNIRVSVTNFDAADTYNLRLSFSGIKDFGEVHAGRQR